jgi:hypothetical protein
LVGLALAIRQAPSSILHLLGRVQSFELGVNIHLSEIFFLLFAELILIFGVRSILWGSVGK